jgi:hypothetical protein
VGDSGKEGVIPWKKRGCAPHNSDPSFSCNILRDAAPRGKHWSEAGDDPAPSSSSSAAYESVYFMIELCRLQYGICAGPPLLDFSVLEVMIVLALFVS